MDHPKPGDDARKLSEAYKNETKLEQLRTDCCSFMAAIWIKCAGGATALRECAQWDTGKVTQMCTRLTGGSPLPQNREDGLQFIVDVANSVSGTPEGLWLFGGITTAGASFSGCEDQQDIAKAITDMRADAATRDRKCEVLMAWSILHRLLSITLDFEVIAFRQLEKSPWRIHTGAGTKSLSAVKCAGYFHSHLCDSFLIVAARGLSKGREFGHVLACVKVFRQDSGMMVTSIVERDCTMFHDGKLTSVRT